MDMLDTLERRLGQLEEPRARAALLCLLQDAMALRSEILRHGSARAALAEWGQIQHEAGAGTAECGPGALAGREGIPELPVKPPGGGKGFPDTGAANGRDGDRAVRRVEEEFRLQERHEVTLLLPGEKNWPASLDTCVETPMLLLVRGDPAVLARPAALALVGSRHDVAYGSRVATKLASAWARMGGVVVSGGAIGVDTAAHEGCLAAGGSTVAVMGTGLAELHPRRNHLLFSAISESGVIASELPMRSRAMPFNFPRRNRIIAALSRAVVVVHARRDSGALHTARFALKCGRLLFTVPAPVDEESCLGGLQLLVQGVPALIGTEQLAGLFADMTGSRPALPRLPLDSAARRTVRLSELSPAERMLLELVSQGTGHVDDLCAAVGLAGRELALRLLSMEMQGWVEKAPGNRYIGTVRLER